MFKSIQNNYVYEIMASFIYGNNVRTIYDIKIFVLTFSEKNQYIYIYLFIFFSPGIVGSCKWDYVMIIDNTLKKNKGNEDIFF